MSDQTFSSNNNSSNDPNVGSNNPIGNAGVVGDAPQSYVDHYQPPVGTAQSPTPVAKSDPLAELEKLLKEYEDKEEKVGHPPAPAKAPSQVAPLAKAMSSTRPPKPPTPSKSPVSSKPPATPTKPKKDPLAELEEALKRYETRSKHSKSKAKAKKLQPRLESRPKVKQIQSSKPPTSSKPPVPPKPKKDPLAELEKLLSEYDKKPSPSPVDLKPAVSNKPEPKPKFERATKSPAPVSTPKSAPEAPLAGQSIEEQNIFELLGVSDSTDQEKEAFLNELQEAIWRDFLDKDLELLIAVDELEKVKTIRNQVNGNPRDAKLQEDLVNEVEKLVPDIEEVLLEKALELKEDMVWERLAGMKEYYAGRDEAISKIQEAEVHFKKGHWQMGTAVLNTLVP